MELWCNLVFDETEEQFGREAVNPKDDETNDKQRRTKRKGEDRDDCMIYWIKWCSRDEWALKGSERCFEVLNANNLDAMSHFILFVHHYCSVLSLRWHAFVDIFSRHLSVMTNQNLMDFWSHVSKVSKNLFWSAMTSSFFWGLKARVQSKSECVRTFVSDTVCRACVCAQAGALDDICIYAYWRMTCIHDIPTYHMHTHTLAYRCFCFGRTKLQDFERSILEKKKIGAETRLAGCRHRHCSSKPTNTYGINIICQQAKRDKLSAIWNFKLCEPSCKSWWCPHL
jgi:hypothetical protein